MLPVFAFFVMDVFFFFEVEPGRDHEQQIAVSLFCFMSVRQIYVGQNTSQRSLVDFFGCKAPFLGRKGRESGKEQGEVEF